ncbi:MAG: hypothetical protein NW200_07205 [Hyphomonadaceae bacterium]|nr:hypothetical protein [Hyphomonadaceae bacterium]
MAAPIVIDALAIAASQVMAAGAGLTLGCLAGSVIAAGAAARARRRADATLGALHHRSRADAAAGLGRALYRVALIAGSATGFAFAASLILTLTGA